MLKKIISIEDKNIEYILKNSLRSKKMRLSIYCNGDFVVTKPFWLGNNFVHDFLSKKSKWILKKMSYFENYQRPKIVDDREIYLKYKKQSLLYIEKKIKKFNYLYKFEYNQIRIKKQKTCWGSCSRKNNLNFNYKILFLPERLADYIIAHELCHLKEFNHSVDFWKLLSSTIPDYKIIRKELKSMFIF